VDIPTEVQVTGEVAYEILWSQSLGRGKHLGECRFKSRQIVLQSDEPKDETLKTFFHELAHCLDHEYGVGLSHKQIYLIEVVIYDFLKLNGFLK
jgi:hypothetical protein